MMHHPRRDTAQQQGRGWTQPTAPQYDQVYLTNPRGGENAVCRGTVANRSLHLVKVSGKPCFHFWHEPLGLLTQRLSESVVVFLNEPAGEVRMWLSLHIDNVQDRYLPLWRCLE